jgi:hypothetical protein
MQLMPPSADINGLRRSGGAVGTPQLTMSTMNVPRTLLLLVLGSIHCGAGRSDLGTNVYEDATASADSSLVGSDGSAIVDGSIVNLDANTHVDAAPPCTQPVVQVGLAGDMISCKFHVSWTCGTTKYDVGGVCAPPGSKQGSGIMAGCLKNGVSTGTINDPDPKSCSCTDAAQTASAVAIACGFSSGQ